MEREHIRTEVLGEGEGPPNSKSCDPSLLCPHRKKKCEKNQQGGGGGSSEQERKTCLYFLLGEEGITPRKGIPSSTRRIEEESAFRKRRFRPSPGKPRPLERNLDPINHAGSATFKGKGIG